MLRRLTLEGFRNFADIATFDLAPHSLLLGQNGSGKTTVLEAIRLLSVGKSFRTSRLEEAISFNRPYFRLETTAKAPPKFVASFFYGYPHQETALIERRLTMNGKEKLYLNWLGTLPTVVFVPDDVGIVLGTPEARRRFLDGALWQVDRAYRQHSLELSRILKERAALLFMVKLNRAAISELHPWNELLERQSTAMRAKRQELVEFIGGWLEDRHTRAKVRLEYVVAKNTVEHYIEQEVRLGQNLYGPQRDELTISVEERVSRRYASRGQARSIAVLLRLAEAAFIERTVEAAPIILLDDMLSELDAQNAKTLFELLPNSAQVLATSLTANPTIKGYQVINLGDA